MREVTDVTVEVFNHCAGTCTGCLLSPTERRATRPAMATEGFARVARALAAYGEQTGRTYRPVLVFGDVPWLPVDVQVGLYEAAASAGLPLGVTMTLVEADRTDAYRSGIGALLDADPRAVFDVTIDPVRLLRDDGYVARLREAISRAPELHLQALLSDALLTRHTAGELAIAVSARLDARAVSLGFTPALSRMGGANFGYRAASAAAFAREFYAATPEGRAHVADEEARFQASGTYGDFIRQAFHVGADMRVYAVAYTMFGDVILDARNGGVALGDLANEDLRPILNGRHARRVSLLSDAGLDVGGFGCRDCVHVASCSFNGIGAVRELYGDFESRAGCCYGPACVRPATPEPVA